ncbi:hypothetical protein [Paracoccus aminophilus]|nr:hypothetical protein [Paracoccus aminophilus]
MKRILILPILALAGLSTSLSPAFADPGNGKGWKNHGGQRAGHGRDDRRSPRIGYRADCPPGLAKKNPPCMPPGQAKKYAPHYGSRVGDILRTRDYVVIRDPRRYDLERRRGWDYYRDDNQIYRVDSGTRKILAVLNLIDAFSR